MKSTKDLHKCFWKRDTPFNISQSSIKLFGEDSNTIVIAMPSEAGNCSSDIKKVAVFHEIWKLSCFVVLEDAPYLVTGKNGFIEVSN